MTFKFIVFLLDARFTHDSLNNLANRFETIDRKAKQVNIRLFNLANTIYTFLSGYKYIGIFYPPIVQSHFDRSNHRNRFIKICNAI